MSDIENELRRLGDNLRSGSRGSETLPGRQRRRIKLRRALFAAGGAVTAIALVATASYGLGLAGDQRGIAPAEDASSTLIRFDRSGGFTGDHHVLTIGRDGSALLESSGPRGVIDSVTFELEPDVMASLQDAVDGVDWPRVEGHRTGSIRIGVADGYRIEISHPPYTVITEPGVDPGSLRPLIGVLNDIIDRRLSDAVAGEPSLALSETQVRPGDVVELAIRARGEYNWGVLTPLEVQRDGGWRRVAYWRTWPGRGPKILEAITSRGGSIEGIGFSGSGYFKLQIPQLDPGIYRITKDFSVVTGAGSEGGEFRETKTAEVRFEVVGGESSTSEDFAAIWPEDTLADAEEACAAAAKEDASTDGEGEKIVSMRYDAASIVLEFGAEVLGWENATAADRSGQSGFAGNRTVYELRRGPQGASPRPAAVVVDTVEVVDGCWSVASVSRLPDKRPTGVSVGVEGRNVHVGVDPLGATSLRIDVVYGGRKVSETGRVDEEGLGEFRLGFDPDTSAYALILFYDANGEVFSAATAKWPAGNFAAG